MKFKIGTKVEHILNHEYLLIVDIIGDKYVCRTKSLMIIHCDEFELMQIKK